MKIILIIFAILEVTSILYALYGLLEIILDKLKKRYDKILDRCAKDIEYRNKIASYIFFFQDMGPNISSFSIISIFITERENIIALIIIFFIGIIMKEKSRKFKHLFYREIEKRSQECQSEQ